MSLQALSDVRGVWSPQCRVIHGRRADRLIDPVGAAPRGIEVRKIPFSPADLRDIKEQASTLEASRKADSRLKRRDASRVRWPGQQDPRDGENPPV